MAGVVNTTYTFTATDLVTSTKLNNLIDETIFTSDAITGTTLEVTGTGKLRVATGGITNNELASNSVGIAKIIDASVTTVKIVDSNVTTAKIADAGITTAKIADGSVTAAKLSTYGPKWNNNTLNIGESTAEASYVLQISPIRSGDGAAAIYFGAQSGVSNSASISRASGSNGALTFINTGIGAMNFSLNGTTAVQINGSTGSLTCVASISATAFNVTSDYRLKSNITALDDQLAAVLALRPVYYTLSAAPRLGLIAHEVQEHFPEAVRGVKDEINEDGQPIYQAIEYTALIPALISAIQSQQRQIDELRAMR